MGRLVLFLVGVLLGGALTYAALRYHLVRAEDGWHPIPRTEPVLDDLVVDVRGFTVADWNAHRELGYAIVRAGRTDLLQRAAVDDIKRAMDGALRSLLPEEPATQ